MTETICLREFDFTLVIDGVDELTDEAMDALYEAGCDDGTITTRKNRMFITFSRRAGSMKDAILEAIQQVRAADIGAVIRRVDDCNLVTQSDIARRIDRTRQQVHQYTSGERGPGNFPTQACMINDKNPLWYWCEVAYWLLENGLIKEEVVQDAEAVDGVNIVLDFYNLEHLRPEFFSRVVNEIVAKM